ncbi:MAG TPA: DNA mismatch repair protein MutS, partial [Candidatus Tenderia electrophaga]|nr:DNA mismatch repair protein MutS [Candidatus Tenderia electrophaga]
KPTKRPILADEQQAVDTLSDEFEPHSDNNQESDSFARPGIQKQLLKKLRLGKVPIEDELDLHGYRVEQARQILWAFLNHSREHGLRCVRIIHGKGLSSQQPPVLRGKTRHWLQQRDDVLAFCPAHRSGGGDGAVYVLLKRG